MVLPVTLSYNNVCHIYSTVGIGSYRAISRNLSYLNSVYGFLLNIQIDSE